jgi:serine acetyltransferase
VVAPGARVGAAGDSGEPALVAAGARILGEATVGPGARFGGDEEGS